MRIHTTKQSHEMTLIPLQYPRYRISPKSCQDIAICRCGKCYLRTINKIFDPIYPTPPLGQDKTQGQFLSGV